MAPATDTRTETSSLSNTASSTLALLRQFTAVLSAPLPSEAPKIPHDSPNPIDVLHTSATLLKAHTTKISLLIINKPFTPSAVRKIISDVANTCIPAMMSAVEICEPSRYGRLLNTEVKIRVRRVFVELETMMVEVLAQASADGGRKNEAGNARDTLTSTGVVWQACDSVMELKTIGIVGLVVKKAQEYREMLEDAMSELKEWGEDDAEEEEEDEDGFEGSDSGNSIEQMLEAANSLPKNRPELKATLTVTLKKLKLVSTLYQALIKRRLKTLEPSPWNSTRADHVMDLLKRIPEQTDELASAFYDLDNDEAQKIANDICDSGKDAVKLMSIGWKSGTDEFTTWSAKWVEAVDKI